MKIKIDLKIFVFLTFLIFMKKIEYYCLFMFFIILHEIAHLITGIILGFKPKEISINIAGVSIEFYNYAIDNKDLAKGVILFSGPFLNIILMMIFYKFNISNEIKMKLISINLILAIVNLLPIFPLDGGKILKIILKRKVGYKKSIIISEKISKIFLNMMIIIYSVLVLKIKNIWICIFLVYLYVLNNKENKLNSIRIRAIETLEKYKINY